MKLKQDGLYITAKEQLGLGYCRGNNINPDAETFDWPETDNTEIIYAVLDNDYVTCYMSHSKEYAEAVCINLNRTEDTSGRTFHVEEQVICDSYREAMPSDTEENSFIEEYETHKVYDDSRDETDNIAIKMSDIYSEGECAYYGIDFNKEVEMSLSNKLKPLYTIGTQDGDIFVPVLFSKFEYATDFIKELEEKYPVTEGTLIPLLSFQYYNK